MATTGLDIDQKGIMMIGSAIPKNKIFREKDLKNIENTLKFEADNMKKQLH